MRFLLQMGHGMMDLNREFIERNNTGGNVGTIIWPRTLTRAQVERHAAELRTTGATVLFDPCFYVPNTSLARILDYPYWDGVDFQTADFTGPVGADFCRRVIEYQVQVLKVSAVLLPGRYANVRNEDWLQMHRAFADVADRMRPGVPVYATVALGPDLLRDRPSLDALLNEIVVYPVDGVYFLYRAPNDQFLCTDDLFLVNLLMTYLSLSLAGKRVILGYANQQDLLAAAAGIETIASGNFRNVRSFNPAIFDEEDESDRRRAIWYYDGNTLSEFRSPQLATAYQLFGLQGRFGPSSPYAAPLLSAVNPANVRWPEGDAFRHYLSVLKEQWFALQSIPRAQRAEWLRTWLVARQQQLAGYEQTRFPLGERSAANAMNSCRNALDAFRALEGPRIALL